MRGFKSTLILLVVLIGLLGYIYYYMKPLSEQPAEQKARVFAVEPDKIEEIQVKTAAGDATTVKKANGVWGIVAPVVEKADEAEVSGIVTNLASLEIQRVIDENPPDLAQYGLATPKTEVAFRKAGESAMTRLLLGDQTATGADIYAKLPAEKKVFLVSSFIETTFNRSTFDLRDKTLLKFERDKVDRVEISGADTAIVLAKAGEQWRLGGQAPARADTTAVDGLIGRLQTAQMKAIAAAGPDAAQLVAFGLDKPALTAVVGAGSARASLLVGAKSAGGSTYYARDAARPMVFEIESSLVDDLRRKGADYRPKDVFDFRPFMATRIEVAREGTTLAFEKTKDKDGKETWTAVPAARGVDAGKMDALLSAFSGLTASEYVDAGVKTGVDRPAAIVTVKFDDGRKEERVMFGRVGADVFAARDGESGAARLEAAKFDAAVAALDALK